MKSLKVYLKTRIQIENLSHKLVTNAKQQQTQSKTAK